MQNINCGMIQEIRCKTPKANTVILFTLPLETPINREVGGGEEFAAALHPLFTTLHPYTSTHQRIKKDTHLPIDFKSR